VSAADLAPILRAEWRLKLLLALTLPLLFCLAYFSLQHLVLFPVRTFRETPLDRAIPFQPAWVYAYQSIYLLMPIAPWLSASRHELVNYTKGLRLLSAGGVPYLPPLPRNGPAPGRRAG
jgi:hypothetical protein